MSLAEIKETKGFVYNSNLIFNIPAGKSVPYFTVGAGLIYQYGDSDLPVGVKFALNYGGGVKFPRILRAPGIEIRRAWLQRRHRLKHGAHARNFRRSDDLIRKVKRFEIRN